MGGCSCENESECIRSQTLILVGKTGNGKSSTGNSILGMEVLKSKRSSSGVTVSSELRATTLEQGQKLNVIDTPGLFDPSLGFEFIGKEIVKCIGMAQDGVDAFLVVISTLTRFSEEEKAAISSLETLFGKKVYDYMIVVFTGGDELEEDNQTLKDFLHDSSESLKETLHLCRNRCVLFDNRTKDESKKLNQVRELLSLVNLVSMKNEGKPYTNEIFTEMKVESKLKETTLKLEQQLAEERAAFVKEGKKAKAAQKKCEDEKQKIKDQYEKAKAARKKSDDEKRKLKNQLEKANKKNKGREEATQRKEEHLRHWEEDLRRRVAGGCFIL